jgi:hypothetical protein
VSIIEPLTATTKTNKKTKKQVNGIANERFPFQRIFGNVMPYEYERSCL